MERPDKGMRRDGTPYPPPKRPRRKERPDSSPVSLIKGTKFKNSRLIAKSGV
jgi:hypothetical protein